MATENTTATTTGAQLLSKVSNLEITAIREGVGKKQPGRRQFVVTMRPKKEEGALFSTRRSATRTFFETYVDKATNITFRGDDAFNDIAQLGDCQKAIGGKGEGISLVSVRVAKPFPIDNNIVQVWTGLVYDHEDPILFAEKKAEQNRKEKGWSTTVKADAVPTNEAIPDVVGA